jgi:uncharacterized protein with LGFP repeats
VLDDYFSFYLNQFIAMKKLVTFLMCAVLAVACKKTVEEVPAHEKAIADKYQALGWTEALDNGGKPEATKGGKGYVQYYANRSKAIYYYSATGAFGFTKNDAAKYDALGQETYRNSSGDLGFPTSDTKPCGTNCTYNDFQNGIIITPPGVGSFTVYGDIYTKYKELNRWEGMLGYPNTDELDLTSKKGRYNGFTKGQIYWSTATGAQAFWGGINKMYGAAGFDTGWLGLPIESCKPENGVHNQGVKFQNGRLIVNLNGSCGYFFNSASQPRLFNGQSAANIPCFDAR